jgi:hypothetical protein
MLPDLREHRADLGPAFAQVLARALSADVDARYPTAGEFLHAMNRGLRSDQQLRGAGWVGRILRKRR